MRNWWIRRPWSDPSLSDSAALGLATSAGESETAPYNRRRGTDAPCAPVGPPWRPEVSATEHPSVGTSRQTSRFLRGSPAPCTEASGSEGTARSSRRWPPSSVLTAQPGAGHGRRTSSCEQPSLDPSSKTQHQLENITGSRTDMQTHAGSSTTHH